MEARGTGPLQGGRDQHSGENGHRAGCVPGHQCGGELNDHAWFVALAPTEAPAWPWASWWSTADTEEAPQPYGQAADRGLPEK